MDGCLCAFTWRPEVNLECPSNAVYVEFFVWFGFGFLDGVYCCCLERILFVKQGLMVVLTDLELANVILPLLQLLKLKAGGKPSISYLFHCFEKYLIMWPWLSCNSQRSGCFCPQVLG